MEVLKGLIMLVAAILQIILFFKVWGMTNNVRKIKDELLSIEELDGFKVGQMVKRRESPYKYRIDKIYSDTKKVKCTYFAAGGVEYTSVFNIDDVEPIESTK